MSGTCSTCGQTYGCFSFNRPRLTETVRDEQLVVIKNCAQTLRDEMREHPNNPEWWWEAAKNLDGALKDSND